VMLKIDNEVTDDDVEFIKFINKVRFCTFEQAERFANGIGLEHVKERLLFLFKNGIINKFAIVDKEDKKSKVPGDAKMFYCMHDGAKIILEHFTDEHISWDFTDNVASSNAMNKYLLNTELFLDILFGSKVQLAYFSSSPEFSMKSQILKAGSQYCFAIPDNSPLYLLVECFSSCDDIMMIRNKIRGYESLLSTNIWKKFYPDALTPPMLFVFTENDGLALEVAQEIKMTTKMNMNNCRFSTRERISGDLTKMGSFLKFVDNNDGGCLEDTNVAIFANR